MKIFFYYTHKESLGHGTRSLSIAEGLSKIASVYVFNGGKEQPFLKIPRGIEYFHLPHPFYDKSNYFIVQSSLVGKEETIERVNFVKSLAKKIKPDIFFTEFFPFGRLECSYELIPLISYFKKKGVRIYASIGYPYIVSENSSVLKKTTSLYDGYFIHTPPGLEMRYLLEDPKNLLLKELYNYFFSSQEKKIFWTGYILPESVRKIKGQLPTERGKDVRVLISRGGGVVSPNVIASGILARKYLPDKYTLEVVAGPSSGLKEFQLFESLASRVGGVNFRRHLHNFPRYLREADISVSLSGYNTSVQLMYFQKRMVLIPVVETSGERDPGTCLEQPARASVLRDYFGAIVLPYRGLTPRIMAEAIKKRASQPSPKEAPPEWFSGLENMLKFLERI